MAAQTSRRQVKIVTLHTLAMHIVPELVGEFLRAETSSSVEIVPSIAGIEAYFDALDSGAAHIVVAYAKQILHPAARNLVEKTVARDHFVPVVARSYVDAGGAVDFNGSRKVPVLAYSPFNFSHTIMNPILQKLEHRIAVRAESTLGESLKALVQQGLGVGWLPRYSVQSELESGAMLILQDKAFHIPFEICAWRRENLEHAAALRLYESWSHRP